MAQAARRGRVEGRVRGQAGSVGIFMMPASVPFLVIESQTLRYVGLAILGVGATLGGPLGVVAVVQEMLADRARLQQAAEDPHERLYRRIQAVNKAFTEAAGLMDELRRDLEAQQATREALLVEAERQQRLLEINKDEAEKIRQILIGETKATIRAERRRQWMYIGIGALLSIPVGVFVNWIS
ncbi:hypothetical protein [Streptosporangium sp. NPDC087985]|uniref:hypothetical protein n=1 Tax=Streptosporangium sp. NPDC087985 TaxID=3366196 RepID=UPI003811F99B